MSRRPSAADSIKHSLTPSVTEALEARCLFATFVVNSTYDAGVGTLRDAINRANAARGASDIRFDLPHGMGQPMTIRPLTPLPVVNVPLTIDGTTQPDYRGRPIVEIDGSMIPKSGAKPGSKTAVDGLRFTSRNNLVRGLIVNGFGDDGIELRGGGGSHVEHCWLGVDRTGGIARGNGNAGVHIANSPSNYVDGCVVSGNAHDGVLIDSAGSHDNRLIGNYIGLDRHALHPLGNGDAGIHITAGASANVVGGTTHTLLQEDGNVISANDDGVLIDSDRSRDNRVLGNFIGTDFTGRRSTDPDVIGEPELGNGVGVSVIDGVANIIGGGAAGARNVICGNSRGVFVDAGRQNRVLGNYIGVDATGATALRNGTGVALRGDDNVVGGPGAGEGNVISGNGTGIFGDLTHRVIVQDNLIGTNAAGNAAIPNRTGIFFDGAGSCVDNVFARNVISGNEDLGLWFSEAGGPGAVRNIIRGNFIGTGRGYGPAIPNGGNGIQIDGGTNNLIGGTSAAEQNVIAYNGGAGVSILGGRANSIRRNAIFSNVGIGIDLGDDGITPNDSTDADTGPNDLQNTPVLTSAATRSGGGGRVQGTLRSTPNSTFTIEFFANEGGPADAEGAAYVGSTTVRTDGSGRATFTVDLPAVARRTTITATATNAGGSTSEFSAGVAVV
jgi:hypothetical protein